MNEENYKKAAKEVMDSFDPRVMLSKEKEEIFLDAFVAGCIYLENAQKGAE